MVFKRPLTADDSGLAPDFREWLEGLTGASFPEPRGETGVVEVEGGAVKVTVDADGFVAEGPAAFRLLARMSLEEYAAFKARLLTLDDIELDKIDILAELAKL